MIIGAVCARKGCKGLPGKNMREMCGFALMDYAVTVGLDSMCEAIVISTDIVGFEATNQRIRHLPRPPELATDKVSKWTVYQHILAWAEQEFHPKTIDCIVDIDVSRPLRTAEDVDKCIAMWWRTSYADTVMAVAPAKKSPYFDIMEMDLTGLMSHAKVAVPKFTCRQDLPPAWYHAGVYVIGADALKTDNSMWEGKVYGCEVSPEAAFDIDDQTDWDICEMLMKQRVACGK
jgi:N-acylneuraminate cytidylyltransferase